MVVAGGERPAGAGGTRLVREEAEEGARCACVRGCVRVRFWRGRKGAAGVVGWCVVTWQAAWW